MRRAIPVVAGLVLSIARPALAQPTDSVAAAEQLFEQARALFSQTQVVTSGQHAAEVVESRQQPRLARKLRAHEEAPSLMVHEFAVGHDVQTVAEKHAGNLVDDAGFVRTVDGQDVSLQVAPPGRRERMTKPE